MSWIVQQVWQHARCDIKDNLPPCYGSREFTTVFTTVHTGPHGTHRIQQAHPHETDMSASRCLLRCRPTVLHPPVIFAISNARPTDRTFLRFTSQQNRVTLLNKLTAVLC